MYGCIIFENSSYTVPQDSLSYTAQVCFESRSIATISDFEQFSAFSKFQLRSFFSFSKSRYVLIQQINTGYDYFEYDFCIMGVSSTPQHMLSHS